MQQRNPQWIPANPSLVEEKKGNWKKKVFFTHPMLNQWMKNNQDSTRDPSRGQWPEKIHQQVKDDFSELDFLKTASLV